MVSATIEKNGDGYIAKVVREKVQFLGRDAKTHALTEQADSLVAGGGGAMGVTVTYLEKDNALLVNQYGQEFHLVRK